METEKYNAGITKMFEFKNQVKDLLAKNKEDATKIKSENEKLWQKLKDKEQHLEMIQKQNDSLVEQKANSKYAQMSQQAA